MIVSFKFCVFSWIVLIWKVLSTVATNECKDGFNNVLSIHDVFGVFDDFKILTYDPEGNALCKTTLTFPGFIKFASGRITLTRLLPLSDGPVELVFTIEKNSSPEGKVCENGKSKNSYIPDEICKFNLCVAVPTLCKIFGEQRSIGITDFPLRFSEFIPLRPLDVIAIAGNWKVSMDITHGNNVVASIQIGDPDKGITIALGDKLDVYYFKKTQEKLRLSKEKEEL